MAKATATTEELIPLILPGAWVRLAHARDVPKHLRGHLAVVVEAQVFTDDGSKANSPSPRPTQYQTPESKFVIRTRDELSETLEVTRNLFEAYSQQGRNELENHG
jgi:hypothetical protein